MSVLDTPADSAETASERPGALPFVVVGSAFAAGILLAKWLDWRGHAHPRR